MQAKDRLAVGAAVACWIMAVAAGLDALYRYQGTPGPPGGAPRSWPAASRLVREPGRFTAVMVVHPGCPCTLASLEQLARILASCEGRLTARVVVPGDAAAGAARWGTRLRDKAAGIPDVEVVLDPRGEEAARFGAATSGHLVLYDPRGARRFVGGITPSRAHAGDTPAGNAIVSLVLGRPASPRPAPVFGCRLMDLVADQPPRVQ